MFRRLGEADQPNTDGSGIEDEPEPRSLSRWLREMIVLIVLAFVIAQGTKAFALQPFIIPSGSMIPTIELNDRVLAEKLTYRFFRPPRQGEIVVFDNPDSMNRVEKVFIKRVIATAGQTVEIRDSRIWVDGVALDEPYTHGTSTEFGTVNLPLTVPSGQVWLMGDNRPGSGDSRFFGPQPVSKVRGRAFLTYWPPERFGTLD